MPWFLLLFAASAVVVVTWNGRRRIGLAAAALIVPLAALFWPGRFYAEKMLTDLAMPLGVLWLMSIGTSVWSLARGRRGQAAAFMAVAALLSFAGNGDAADLFARRLEAPYLDIDPFAAERLDAVCVLGGGMATGPGRRIMTNSSGDRVVLGARLYHSGVAPRLVCTGNSPQLDPSLPSAADITETAWRQLGVPAEAITKVAGEHTQAEMAELKRLSKERGWPRLGLVTSAWHMGRAERLAAAAGVKITPLPADFQSRPAMTIDPWLRVRAFSIVPSGGGASTMSMALKEFLARLVGR